jgi:hypothetical protein
MFDKLFGGCGCGCEKRDHVGCNSSCDVLWIIILLLVVFNGGLFGLDICTLVILFIIFGGGNLFGCERKERCC